MLALIINDQVAQILEASKEPLEQRFHPDFVARCREVDDDLQLGDTVDDKGRRVAPTPAAAVALTPDAARAKRDALLAATDWTQLGDNPRAGQDAWVKYRQALRDVTKQAGFPASVDWPPLPA